jgi:hypothetical protein
MAQLKTRFTVWMEPEILRAAKARAVQDGVTVSEVLAAAAKRALIDTDRQNTDAKLLAAVERVFNLIQRIDRRRVYDQQVLKEMVGLLIRSFFNHIPAVPPKEKDAALISGKARFNRFLDMLAGNLRSGQSILNDLPVPEQQQTLVPIVTQPEHSTSQDSVVSPPPAAVITPSALPPVTVTIAAVVKATPSAGPDRMPSETAAPAANQQPPKPPKPAPPRKWGLFQ